MNTEERLKIVEEKLDRVLAFYSQENFNDKMVLRRGLQLKDKKYLTVLDSNKDGISIGSQNSKVGFYDATPITRTAGISNPAGGATVDTECRTAVTAILSALRNIGITS